MVLGAGFGGFPDGAGKGQKSDVTRDCLIWGGCRVKGAVTVVLCVLKMHVSPHTVIKISNHHLIKPKGIMKFIIFPPPKLCEGINKFPRFEK